MTTQQILLETIGYIASILAALSLTMRNIKKLRYYNLSGSLLFVFYGTAIRAWPVAALNAAICITHFYELARMHRQQEFFTVRKIDIRNAWYINYFFERCGDDIRKFFPAFTIDPGEKYDAAIIFRDVLPAGLLVLRETDGPDAELVLDYSHPNFRDFRNAHYFLDRASGIFNLAGKKSIITPGHSKEHIKYLKRMDFVPAADRPDWYRRPLGAIND